jgi:hypothetical protein
VQDTRLGELAGVPISTLRVSSEVKALLVDKANLAGVVEAAIIFILFVPS